ncbi:uncharacterized protein EI97DRAFT_183888 [Westerdykella ornata]|uniref:Uncharacterized protein n=1 Tax=Westerdykella ornata TaxID=318751 RepID=A0A6A6JSU1_WESOR|nr:uncharacterized protein EI97DRAFT_183888 [Westerdykella ornata]KAF2279681.1 hypothetical protein EI97DRAFT_183888 [Westerdykella ornata]
MKAHFTTLPHPLLTLLTLLTTPLQALTFASASPAPLPLVPDAYVHLIPRHTLFLRQLPASSSSNLQTFTSNVGGFGLAPPITDSGDPERPFEVEGDTFTTFEAAAQRSCDRQFGVCAEGANADGGGGVSVGECDGQKDECNRAQDAAPIKDFQSAGGGGQQQQQQAVVSENIGPDPEFPDFDLICEA